MKRTLFLLVAALALSVGTGVAAADNTGSANGAGSTVTDNSTDNSGQNNSSTVTPTADSNNQVGQSGDASNTGDNTSTQVAVVDETSSAYSGLAITINGGLGGSGNTAAGGAGGSGGAGGAGG